MRCSKCGAELRDGVAFCRECGTKVEKKIRFCRECGCEIPAGIKFCPGCGAKINIPAAGIPQEQPDQGKYSQGQSGRGEQPYQEQSHLNQSQPMGDTGSLEGPNKKNTGTVFNKLDIGKKSDGGVKKKALKSDNRARISPKTAMCILGGVVLLLLVFLIGRGGAGKSGNGSKTGTNVQSSTEKTAEKETKPTIVMIDVGGLALNEAIQQLKDAGFEKIVTNASSDPSWSEDRWIVAEQSIAPGNNAYADEEVKLTCKKLCRVYLDLRSEGNLIFDTYDMEIWFNGKELGSVENGANFTKLVEVPEGQYEAVIHKAGDDSVSAKKTLTVEGDMTFKTDISHGGKISFKNMETSDGVIGAALEVDDVTGMILSDAMRKLETVGFVNIKYEPNSDIWDRNNWIVTSQNLDVGTTADKNEVFQLNCIRLSDYFNNTYSGKYLNEVQKLAADEGFELRYKNTADSRNLNDSITSESEERKKRWKVDAARQYSGKIAELSLTYEPTPEERAAEEARLAAESKAAEESRAKAESEAAERSKAEEESKAKAAEESRAAAESKAKAEEESKAAEESKAKEEQARRAEIEEKVVLPESNSKLGRDFDSEGRSTWCYINVDDIKNKPVKKKWKSVTVTDGVAEYLNRLENLGYKVKITDYSSKSPYSGFTLYETYFKVTGPDVEWTMYLCIEDELFVEYELDIDKPEE